MAGDWIKMRSSLWNDGRVNFIARNASVTVASRSCIVGALFRLWTLADEQSEHGFIFGWNEADLDAEVDIPGFAKALQHPQVRWLEVSETGLKIPRFDDHNSESAKARAMGAKRQRRSRKRHADNVTSPLPEKRREEKSLTPTESEKPPVVPQRGTDAHRNGTDEPPGFVRFWDKYPKPRRTAKKACLKIWRRDSLEAKVNEILSGLARHVSCRQWNDPERGSALIPLPATFLNQGRWDGHPEQSNNNGGGIIMDFKDPTYDQLAKEMGWTKPEGPRPC